MTTHQAATGEHAAVSLTPSSGKVVASRRVLITIALLTVYIIWSTTYLAIRFALESFPPYLMMGIRFVVAGGILFAFLLVRGSKLPTRREWWGAGVIGFLMLVMGMGNTANAETMISSGLAASLIAAMPLITLLLSLAWGNRPTRSEWIGVGIGLAGVILLTLEGNLQANPLGLVLIFIAITCWSLGSLLVKRVPMPSGVMGNAAEMLIGGLLLCGWAALRGESVAPVVTPGALLALVYLITFGSLATMTAYMYLLKNVSPALATSYSLVNPGLALILGVILGGEVITGSALIALPLIILGIAFVFGLFERRRKA
ncbi:MAG: drug/metabolite exporter YedA [Anaerolinea sp.]|nr:drug/metabolite exporter YedA [Anaerolinea sp.]